VDKNINTSPDIALSTKLGSFHFKFFVDRKHENRHHLVKAISTAMRQQARDDISLDSSDSMLPTNPSSEWVTDKQACAVCYAVEGVMTTLFTASDFAWSSEESIADSPTDSPTSNKQLTPSRICRMWKKKRRAEKIKLRELRGKDGLFSESELMSETKQCAQKIQRSFEKRFDENDYSQRYERYGSRATFIRDKHA
jgi:hypothetical protein